MRARSSTPAGAVYLDRGLRIRQLGAAAERARRRLPALRRVVVFGSLADGTAGPRSDADLLVVLATSPHPDPKDRVPEVLAALAPLPCPLVSLWRPSTSWRSLKPRAIPCCGRFTAAGSI